MANTVLKILVLGDAGVGKTSIIKRYTEGVFTRATIKATVAADFSTKSLTVFSGTERSQKVKLQIWDIAGQERFGNQLTRVYYKDAVGAIIVYDISQPKTFETVGRWKNELDKVIELLPGMRSFPVILVGNKSDLEPPDDIVKGIDSNYQKDYGLEVQSQIDVKYIENFCSTHNIVYWADVSALEDRGINEVVSYLTEAILNESGNAFEFRRRQQASFKPGLPMENVPLSGGLAASQCC